MTHAILIDSIRCDRVVQKMHRCSTLIDQRDRCRDDGRSVFQILEMNRMRLDIVHPNDSHRVRLFQDKVKEIDRLFNTLDIMTILHVIAELLLIDETLDQCEWCVSLTEEQQNFSELEATLGSTILHEITYGLLSSNIL